MKSLVDPRELSPQVSSSARKILFGFSLLSSILFVLSLGFLSSVGFLGPIIWSIVSLLLLNFATSRKRKYFIPVCFAFFLVVGIQLNAANLFFNAERLDSTVFSPHRLAVDSKIFLEILLELLASGCALVVVTLLVERTLSTSRGPSFAINSQGSRSIAAGKYTLLYFLICSALIGFMGHLGIGVTGLPPEVELPFKLTGILVYAKNVAVPFFGYLLFMGAINSGNKGSTLRVGVVLLVLGIMGSIAFLSRGFIIFMIAPMAVHLFLYRFVWQRSYRKFILWVLLGFLGLALAANVVKVQREARYFGQQYSWIDSISDSGPWFILEGFRDVFDLVVGRVSGFREIALAHTLGAREGSLPLDIFFGNQDSIDYVNRYGFNFERSPDDLTAFGYSFGLLGTLSLSDSLVVIFLGAFLFLFVGLLGEALFIKLSRDFGTIFGFSYLFSVWGGLDSQHFLRLLFVFSILFVCSVAVVRSSTRKRPFKEKRFIGRL